MRSRLHRRSAGLAGAAAGLCFTLLACALATLLAQAPAPALTTDQVVARMVAMNQARTRALHAFTALRSYHVEYSGLGHKTADMTVRVSFHQPGPKHFTILSESGSGMLRHHVLEPLLKAERKDAALTSANGSAIVPANYRFELGATPQPDGDHYVLEAIPRKGKERAYFRGEIWVNANDFGIERVVGKLPQSPSFWVTSAEFDYRGQKIGDFWLPASNATLAHIRFFGHAELDIRYHDFELTSISPVPSGADGQGEDTP